MLENIRTHLDKYLREYPEEHLALRHLTQQVTPYCDITSRSNFEGHVTASAVIVDELNRGVIAIRNRALNLWLFPGGHIDPLETPECAAIREAKEETSIDLARMNAKPQLIEINTHRIPANQKKQEPEHYHHDFRFLFVVDKVDNIELDANEISGFQIVKLSDLDQFEFAPSLSASLSRVKLLKL